jgi:hypothetical protein
MTRPSAAGNVQPTSCVSSRDSKARVSTAHSDPTLGSVSSTSQNRPRQNFQAAVSSEQFPDIAREAAQVSDDQYPLCGHSPLLSCSPRNRCLNRAASDEPPTVAAERQQTYPRAGRRRRKRRGVRLAAGPISCVRIDDARRPRRLNRQIEGETIVTSADRKENACDRSSSSRSPS